MSISTITTGTQSCRVDIKWLQQCYVLDAKNDSLCVMEFIVEVQSGNLNYLDVYFPFKISGLKNRTPKFFDENNKYFYTEGFKVVSIDPKNAKSGEIILDGLKTGIGEVFFEEEFTKLGSKITINFSKPISLGESRAVRMQFDCKKLSIESSANERSITLSYYDFNNAIFLNLDAAVHINHFFVWVVFPHRANLISNITPHFSQQRILDKVNLKRMATFYGSKTRAIWGKLPRTIGFWERHIKNREPVLRAWTTLYLHCDYAFHNSEFQEIIKPKNEKLEYAIFLSRPSGIGRIEKEDTEEGIHKKYLEKKNNYDIFIYEETVYIKKIAGKKINMLIVRPDKNILNLLILFLKHKNDRIPYGKLYHKAWEGSIEHGEDARLPEDVRAMNGLKTAVATLRRKFKPIRIPHARAGGYICEGDFKFCVVLKQNTDRRYTLEGV